jgi:hypothetical protein
MAVALFLATATALAAQQTALEVPRDRVLAMVMRILTIRQIEWRPLAARLASWRKLSFRQRLVRPARRRACVCAWYSPRFPTALGKSWSGRTTAAYSIGSMPRAPRPRLA